MSWSVVCCYYAVVCRPGLLCSGLSSLNRSLLLLYSGLSCIAIVSWSVVCEKMYIRTDFYAVISFLYPSQQQQVATAPSASNSKQSTFYSTHPISTASIVKQLSLQGMLRIQLLFFIQASPFHSSPFLISSEMNWVKT